jgi:hypothetical protein
MYECTRRFANVYTQVWSGIGIRAHPGICCPLVPCSAVPSVGAPFPLARPKSLGSFPRGVPAFLPTIPTIPTIRLVLGRRVAGTGVRPRRTPIVSAAGARGEAGAVSAVVNRDARVPSHGESIERSEEAGRGVRRNPES